MIKFPGRLNLRPYIAQTAFVRVVTPRKRGARVSWGLDLTQNLTKKFDVACFETHISIGDVRKILLYNNALLNYTGYG